jgi:hypothetical protein
VPIEDVLRNRPQAVPADDESDVIVALVRSAIVLTIMLLPWLAPDQRDMIPTLHVAAIAAAAYTLALFVARLLRRWLPLQRFVAICVDLFLVSAAIMQWPTQSGTLFQLYYIIVIVAAMWFGRHGALTAAVASLAAYLIAQYATADMVLTGRDIWPMLWLAGAPVLLILAFVSSFVLRARDVERTRSLRLNHELQLARSLQRAMLPDKLPPTKGYDLAVRLEAARLVSGDLYDFIALDEDTLLMFIADVAGKSVHGMMHVSLLHSHLKAAAKEGLPPAAIADVVNRSVYDALQPSSFASAFIAHLHLPTGRFVYVNCGHPPPLLLRGGGLEDPVSLSTDTTMIGVTSQPGYVQMSAQLEPGDMVVAVTDGVLEARNREGEFFDDEGLLAALSGMQHASAEEVASSLMRTVTEFAGGVVDDDAIVTVLRRDAD